MKNITTIIFLSFLTVCCFFFYLKKSNYVEAKNYYSIFCNEYHERDYESAKKNIDLAVDVCPDNALYNAYAGLNECRIAINSNSIRQLITKRIHPAEYQKEKIKSAIYYYENAGRLNKNDDNFYHNLAWLYCFLGNFDNAVANIKKALEIEPTVALNQISMGLILEITSQGELKNILKFYENAICISPSILDSDFFCDLIKRFPRDIDDLILNAIGRLSKKQYNPIFAARLAKIYIYKQDYERADSLLHNVIMKIKNMNRVWSNLGFIYKQKNELKKAEEYFKKANFLDMLDAHPYLELGLIFLRKNDYNRSVAYLSSALKVRTMLATEHARRIMWVYQNSVPENIKTGIINNDVIPFDLLEYSNPEFNWKSVCNYLAKALSLKGKVNLANKIKELKPEQIDKLDEILLD